MGHEIGYHYEDVSISALRRNGTTAQRQKTGKGRTTHDSRRTEEELAEIAIESFKTNLEKLRQIVPVKTICMHGSPMSRWDSRLLWKYYDYHDFGIIGEPYFDIDFDEVLYLTDTGRSWDGDSFNIRDKAIGDRQSAVELSDLETKRLRDFETMERPSVPQSLSPSVPPSLRPSVPPSLSPSVPPSLRPSVPPSLRPSVPPSLRPSVPPSLRPSVPPSLRPSVPPSLRPSVSQSLRPSVPPSHFHSTYNIIHAAKEGRLPDRIMLTFHPQRWTDKPVPWVKELVWQNVKNVAKYFLVKMRSK